MVTDLLLKMAGSAAVVVLASLVVERSGPLVGAMVATLPISAGPAYAFLAMEHGPGFIAATARASLATIGITAVYIATYAVLAQRDSLARSLGLALPLWLLLAAASTRISWTLVRGLAVDGLCFGLAFALAWRHRRVKPARRPARSRWDVPGRALGVMLLVAAVVIAGRRLGPRVAGVAALAPVVMTSLAVILHRRLGGPASAAVQANALPGMVGNVLSLVVVSQGAEALGSAPALLLALGISVGWNGGLVALSRWRHGRRERGPEAAVIRPVPAGEVVGEE